MREILFRGKRVGDERWVEGFYCEYPEGYAYIQNTSYDRFAVLPKTVGQYTGLCDMNGTKIFEGDVIKYRDGRGNLIGRITWNETHLAYTIFVNAGDCGYYYIDEGLGFDMQVIGNIHDNPELMK